MAIVQPTEPTRRDWFRLLPYALARPSPPRHISSVDPPAFVTPLPCACGKRARERVLDAQRPPSFGRSARVHTGSTVVLQRPQNCGGTHRMRAAGVGGHLSRLGGHLSPMLRDPLRRAMFSTGVYISLAGAMLLAAPGWTFGLLAPASVDAVSGAASAHVGGVGVLWIRVGGVLAQLFGLYYLMEALLPAERQGFTIGSIVGRVYLFVAFCAVYWAGNRGAARSVAPGGAAHVAPALLPFLGAVNFVSAVATLRAMRVQRQQRLEHRTPRRPRSATTSECAMDSSLSTSRRQQQTDDGDSSDDGDGGKVFGTFLCRVLRGAAGSSVSGVEIDRSGRQVLLSGEKRGEVVLLMSPFDSGGSDDDRIQPELVHRFSCSPLEVSAFGFCDDGGVWVASVDRPGGSAIVYGYKAQTFAMKRKVVLPLAEVMDVRFAPDGEHVLVRSVERCVLELRADASKVLWRRQVGTAASATPAAAGAGGAARGGGVKASGAATGLGSNATITTRIRWSDDRQLLAMGLGSANPNKGKLVRSTESSESDLLISMGTNGTQLVVIRASDGEVVSSVVLPSLPVAVDVSAVQNAALALGFDGQVRVYRLDGSEIQRFSVKRSGAGLCKVVMARFMTGGRFILTPDEGGVHLWPVPTVGQEGGDSVNTSFELCAVPDVQEGERSTLPLVSQLWSEATTAPSCTSTARDAAHPAACASRPHFRSVELDESGNTLAAITFNATLAVWRRTSPSTKIEINGNSHHS